MQPPNQLAPRIYSRDPNLHGSSRLADKIHLKNRGLDEFGNIFLGYGMAEHKKGRSFAITTNTQKHLLTVAPTRSGKLLTASLPRCMEHQGSIFAIDVKDGELSLITARYRKHVLGHKVVIIDPWDIACSHLGIIPSRFNVLDWLDPESEDFVEDATLIADSLITTHGSKDPFWNDEARALIMGLVMYVAATPSVLIPTQEKSRDLAQVRRLLNLPANRFKEMVDGAFEEDEEGSIRLVHAGMAQSRSEPVRAAAARIMSKASKEFSGVISTAQQNTHFLESPRIQKSLSESDFSFDELENGKIDIFIVLPAGRLFTYNRFLRMLISIAITAVTRFKTKPNPPVYFLLEEAAALGRLEVIETAFGLMAGYGMQLHLIVQDFNQLVSLYSERWQTFVANSGVIQIFGTRDLMTAEYISRLCGITTMESLSESSAAFRAGLLSDPNYLSRDDALTSRSLITPDEIMTMHPAAQILILSNAHPVACFKTVYFLDKRYRDKNGKPLFDIHPHYADRLLASPVNFMRSGFDIGGALAQVFDGG
ncbi:type IV secretory system conjugative DNA transfer family protein [Candidatus Vondammii sp. HM_W22]|uniref:type IV secretory system conjugative DNA transfer family protein n=1 Tax=Candidatus Vondammii sp. HM_W22 TaxID=2687299 RepID=UPI001F12EFFD|nr:type IV secretory system conjugative DNA transfer family protein [Candidatus Vondammii sp. HM_W22]